MAWVHFSTAHPQPTFEARYGEKIKYKEAYRLEKYCYSCTICHCHPIATVRICTEQNVNRIDVAAMLIGVDVTSVQPDVPRTDVHLALSDNER